MRHRQRLLPSQLVMRVPNDFVEIVSEVASSEAMSTAAFIRCAVIESLRKREVAGVLAKYRQALQQGADPSEPSQHFRGRPELELEYQQACDSLADGKEKRAGAKRSKAIGKAARLLRAIPEGPMRKKVGRRR